MDYQEVVTLMESSKSAAEWNANCDKVKAVYGGRYPSFWYAAILASGVAARTAKSFGSRAAITVTVGSFIAMAIVAASLLFGATNVTADSCCYKGNPTRCVPC